MASGYVAPIQPKAHTQLVTVRRNNKRRNEPEPPALTVADARTLPDGDDSDGESKPAQQSKSSAVRMWWGATSDTVRVAVVGGVVTLIGGLVTAISAITVALINSPNDQKAQPPTTSVVASSSMATAPKTTLLPPNATAAQTTTAPPTPTAPAKPRGSISQVAVNQDQLGLTISGRVFPDAGISFVFVVVVAANGPNDQQPWSVTVPVSSDYTWSAVLETPPAVPYPYKVNAFFGTQSNQGRSCQGPDCDFIPNVASSGDLGTPAVYEGTKPPS